MKNIKEFEEMIKDWLDDNIDDNDRLIIDEIETEGNTFIAYCHDEEHTYSLTEYDGNIFINYLGLR